ncbi:C4-dicarboxylate ABC transporter permease [Sporosarcina sp. P21c]|uniref:TRAP transporter large permease n=1 Tax=unclassified Sporosarcina TaxID=2647733 RepID=UPI000C167017|nr:MULTISPECIES: TRAP transporter large permease [unclassified Sporosarcina]PIC67835.1 C4-dicarboxylate ABC transporter permease [Sporosarcina sp. P16a]PIC90694.1 C4-dicarboxylate ABC transporter permease [Sporosarcina sp. P21c]PIC93459.1 C4-dicarboxylate ABC transporter permease [Sporosarcina sp. P25]
MMALVLFLSFLVLIFIGVPVAFSLGLSSLLYLFINDMSFSIIPQRMFGGLNSFVLLCIPGFILAGNLMNAGGITDRIIQFANNCFGHIRGGLGLANVGSSMGFAGISGTALADTASIGAVMIPAMKKEGYGAGFSAAVTASSSTVGPIIPPSLPMIIVGTLASVSIGDLFLAGAVPGILLGLGLMIPTYLISVKRNYPKGERKSFKEISSSFLGAFWALFMTVIILVGILGGIFTPTEASVIAVLYALVIGIFVYKELPIRKIPEIMLDSMTSTASIMLLVGFANLFGWIMVSEQIPQLVASTILGISSNPIIVIILINILLLFVGTFMETIAALVILFPVLLPVAMEVGMDPVQFGVMMVLNLVIGLTTPPVGVCLFVASQIGKVSIGKTTKELLPFLGVSLVILLLVSFVPQITLYLPSLFK